MSEVMALEASTAAHSEKLDAIVVGGGLGGLYALHRLRRLGLKAKEIGRAHV